MRRRRWMNSIAKSLRRSTQVWMHAGSDRRAKVAGLSALRIAYAPTLSTNTCACSLCPQRHLCLSASEAVKWRQMSSSHAFLQAGVLHGRATVSRKQLRAAAIESEQLACNQSSLACKGGS